MPTDLMTPAQLAQYLSLDAGTLQNWRVARQGPPWVKLGKGRGARVAYRVKDVEKWIADMTVPALGTSRRKS